MQEANHVFLFDRWWNPAIEKQAVARAYRRGQTKPVHVYKFVTRGTVEEKIVNDVSIPKQLLADGILFHSDADFSGSRIRQWFSLDKSG